MLDDILVPIFVCVVLPVSIVLIVFLASMNADNKRSQILLKALEVNPNMNVDTLAEALKKPRRSPQEMLARRLLRGCAFSILGVLLVAYSVIATATGDNVEFSDDSVFFPCIGGAILLAFGIGYLVVYFATRKQVNDNKEEEE